jgi:hypothetical protein
MYISRIQKRKHGQVFTTCAMVLLKFLEDLNSEQMLNLMARLKTRSQEYHPWYYQSPFSPTLLTNFQKHAPSLSNLVLMMLLPWLYLSSPVLQSPLAGNQSKDLKMMTANESDLTF